MSDIAERTGEANKPSNVELRARPARECGVNVHDLSVYAAIAGLEPVIDPALKDAEVLPIAPAEQRRRQLIASGSRDNRNWSPWALCDGLRRTVQESIVRQVRRPEIAEFIRRITEAATRDAQPARRVRSVQSRLHEPAPVRHQRAA
jgi:hypothetical protein